MSIVTESESQPLELQRELPKLRVLASRLVRDEDEANDLLHDAWLDVVTAGTVPLEQHDARRWLGGVLRNRARMRQRARARRQRREQASAALPSPAACPEHTSHLRRVLEALLTEMKKLDAEDRQMLDLRLQGMSAVAIGRHQGMPAATVRTRIHRALSRLRDGLDRRFGDRGRWLPAIAAFPGQLSSREANTVSPVAKSVLLFLAAAAAIGAGWAVLRPRQESPLRVAVETPQDDAWSSTPDDVARGHTVRLVRGRRHQAALVPPLGSVQEADGSTASTRAKAIPLEDALTEMTEQTADCLAMLPQGAVGSLRLQARVLTDPELGGLVESIHVMRDAVEERELTECLEQSTYAVAFPTSSSDSEPGPEKLWIVDFDVEKRFVALRDWGLASDPSEDAGAEIGDPDTVDMRRIGLHTTRSRQDILDRLAASGWSKNEGSGWIDPASRRVFIGCTIARETVACGTRPAPRP